MAGTSPDFNAAEFRDGIRFAMDLAAPPLAGERVTFYFQSTLVYTGEPVDDENVPFDPDAVPVVSQPTPPKQVSCAVEYFDAMGNTTNFGDVLPDRATLTLLDEEYEQIKDFAYVALRGERFNLRSIEPPVGMFDVGIYTIHCVAANKR